MYRQNDLGLLVRLDRRKAEHQILDAHRRTGGNTVHAALALGVSRRHLARFIVELDLGPKIEKLRSAGSGTTAVHRAEKKRA